MVTRSTLLAFATATAVAATAASVALGGRHSAPAPTPAPVSAPQALPAPPPTLGATGLYADLAARTLADGVRPFTPQYPLWSDGAGKERWIWLPPGSTIDATRADAWQFPVGTRLWKQFTFDRRVETRYMERAASGWVYATYVWSDDGKDAVLAPAGGAPSVELASGVRHDVPSLADCKTCHDTAPSPVLGFSALQLSPDRDPGALHAETPAPGSIDLSTLIAEGRLRGTEDWLQGAPRIAASSPVERAALGYLHGNCGGCHRPGGAADSLGMYLAQSLEPGAGATVEPTTFGVPSRYQPPGARDAVRVAPGAPDASVLVLRMRSREPAAQMPPIGTHLVDPEATALVTRWIALLPSS